MDLKAAEQIVPMLTRAAGEVDATIDIFREHASDEQAKRYAEAVKLVIFAIDDVLRPIILEHPQLHP